MPDPVARRMLVTGGAGQLGRALAVHTWPAGWHVVALGSDALDVTDERAVAGAIAAHRPAGVINAAAYTAVDRAEAEPARAWIVNAVAPAILGAACRDAGVPIVHVSTDYVFDGGSSDARRPDDRPTPLGLYGASKLGGEIAVAASGARQAIVRTAWLVSGTGTNFVRTMLRLAGERDAIRVVDDQHGTPTAAADLAAALATIACRFADDPARASGTWHFANTGATTWARFAEAIMAGSRARGGATAAIERIATADYPTPARRPAYSMLDTSDLVRDFLIRPRPWQVALEDILDELIGPRP